MEMEKRQQTMERNDNNPQLLLEELNEIEQRLLQISADQVSSSFYHAACVLCVCCWCQSSPCAIVCRTMRLTVCCASPQALSHQALRALASLSPASLSLFLQNYAHKKLDLLCEIFPTQAFT